MFCFTFSRSITTMLKNKIRNWCQQLIGLNRYLFVFSWVNIFRIRYLGAEKEFVFFMKQIQGDGIILDIGANVGTMTIVLAQKFPNSRIYAFEPVPANARTIRQLTGCFRLKNINLITTALGNTNGTTLMVTPAMDNSIMHGLSYVWQQPARAAPADAFEVPVTRLDSIPELGGEKRITAIKIDVENFEYYVLEGGRNLLQKHRPLVYAELWDDAKRSLCMQLMQDLGYTAAVYRNGELVKYTGEDALNYFFLPGGSQ